MANVEERLAKVEREIELLRERRKTWPISQIEEKLIVPQRCSVRRRGLRGSPYPATGEQKRQQYGSTICSADVCVGGRRIRSAIVAFYGTDWDARCGSMRDCGLASNIRQSRATNFGLPPRSVARRFKRPA